MEYIAWKNGTFLPAEECAFSALAQPLQDAFMVTEDVLCIAAEGTDERFAFRAKAHVETFLRSARAAFLDVPFAADKLRAALLKLAAKTEAPRFFIRMMAYQDGVAPCAPAVSGEIVVLMVPFAADNVGIDAPQDGEGIAAAVSSWRRPSADALPAQVALSAHRATNAFARQEASARGCLEALLLNAQGNVCESTAGSVFAVRDGVLSTPPLAEGVFESVMRDAVMHLAIDLEIPIIEEALPRADLYRAQELFLAGGLEGIQPVASIDGLDLGSCGPITKAIADRLVGALGTLPEYADWRTAIK